MTTKRWLTIDPSLFRQPVSGQIGKATVVSSTSPYSVPDAVSTYDDKTSGRYVLEFKYIGPEEPLETFRWNRCTLEKGKNSKRLFKVLITHEPGSPGQYPVDDFKNAIEQLGSTTNWPIENYRVLSDVIARNKDKLMIYEPQETSPNEK